jgi:hypothetical protein
MSGSFNTSAYISRSSISTNVGGAGARTYPIAQVWTKAAAAASPVVASVSSVDDRGSVESCPWLTPQQKDVTHCERARSERERESDDSKTNNDYIRETGVFVESLYSAIEKYLDTPFCSNVATRLIFRDLVQSQFLLSNRNSC